MPSVVITGASRGLGLASATHLYKQGWHVVAAIRSVDTGMAKLRTATGASADDQRLTAVQLDLMDSASIATAAQEIINITGGPDVVVHNAGLAAAGAAEETPMAVWQQLFATNLFGPVELTNALLPSMRAKGRGRIVAISSVGGIRGMPGISTYSASKGALERWAESLSQEIAPFGLGVSIIVTGTFDTDIITEKTPDYGDHSGAYAKVYHGIHTAGKKFVSTPASPQKFAEELEAAMNDDAVISRRTVGTDAKSVVMMSRILPGRIVHSILRLAMQLPNKGSLRQQN